MGGDAYVDRSNWDPRQGLAVDPVGDYDALKRAFERHYGVIWPLDPKTGKSQDAAHIKAVADGGEKYAVTNIQPMTREEHIAQHKANNDFARFARRRWIAQAFGGRVAKGIGAFSILPMITGILSGRIRSDTLDNALSDMAGVPSQEDQRRRATEIY